ncbi:MAG: hypothetical protein K5905_01365 [Roseibium sp.]|uniref:phosphopantetheine-binding protein n=1 Tax=Roseibium sp. TaxID=1936156 RepID=UPI00261CF73F|nr:phosphopantetheine-binding protein [Roseibium sp.]MCV0424098.1 hypothetical protein [Roseibium sp.]
MSDIFDKIKAITARNFNLATWIINRDTTLSRLGADSLDAIGLIMAVERELGCLVPNDAFSAAVPASGEMTFGTFVDIIEKSIRRDGRKIAG